MREVIYSIEKIHKRHNVEKFKCGLSSLDSYIQQYAIKETEEGIATTKVIIGSKGSIIGYYTISCSAIIDCTGGKQQYSSAIELKMFAINDKFRGKEYPDEEYEGFKYSEVILWKAIEDIDNIRKESIGAEYIVLYAVPHAVSLYSNNGFCKFTEYMNVNEDDFLEGCIPMFLKF